MLTCCFRFWRSINQEKVIVLGEISAISLYFHVFILEDIKPKIYEIVNHRNWIVHTIWWYIEEMDVGNINGDNFAKHVDRKGKIVTLFCVFKINWNCWIVEQVY